ncbi:MAG: hypothetical protein QME81_11640 [bacterium]|nr:hypothetical protein [bacterium]
MGRVRKDIQVSGNDIWTLFDTGSRNTYVAEDVASGLQTFDLEEIEPVRLGGKRHEITKDCRLICRVEGLPVRINARVIDRIGFDEEGKRIEVLFGALAMQEWGIELNLEKERLDMSHYPKEFVEF